MKFSYPFPSAFERARYDERYLQLGLTEAKVQEATKLRLEYRYRARVTVIDSGDRRFRGEMVRRYGIAGRELNHLRGSMEPGIADLAVTFPSGRAGWIEVKRPCWLVLNRKTGNLVQRADPGEPTAEQLQFLLWQTRFNAVAGVVWRDTDVDALIGEREEAFAA